MHIGLITSSQWQQNYAYRNEKNVFDISNRIEFENISFEQTENWDFTKS